MHGGVYRPPRYISLKEILVHTLDGIKTAITGDRCEEISRGIIHLQSGGWIRIRAHDDPGGEDLEELFS